MKKVNVRNRILISSFLIAFLFFLFFSPIFIFFENLVFRPTLNGLMIIERNNESIKLDIINNDRSFINKNIILKVLDNENQLINIEGVLSEEIKLDIDSKYSSNDLDLIISFKNFLGIESDDKVVNIPSLNNDLTFENINSSEVLQVEFTENNIDSLLKNLLIAIFISLVLLILTGWIFSFKVFQGKAPILSFYPSLISFSYILLSLSIGEIFNYQIQNVLANSLIFPLIFFVLTYFVLLTVNIIYNSLFYELPLEQAGRASQFVFSLLSAYFLLIYVYILIQDLGLKILIMFMYIFLLTFSTSINVRNKNITLIFYSSLSIAIVLCLVIFVTSLWPINYILSMILAGLTYYILLSLNLETSQKISSSTWVEFLFLILFLSFIIFSTANWGINGGLF